MKYGVGPAAAREFLEALTRRSEVFENWQGFTPFM
jgi:hypothetical protein